MMNLLEIFSNVGLLVGLLTIIVLYLIYWFQRPKDFPPGPRGIPIFGYLPMFGRFATATAAELSKKYGPVLGVRIGSSDIVFLNDYESINEVCRFFYQIFN